MLTIHADASGRLLRVEFPVSGLPVPDGTAESLTFDEVSNPALAADLGRNAAAYWLQGGVLHRHAEIVAIAPDAPVTVDQRQVQQAVSNLRAYVNAETTTTAQDKVALRLLCRAALVLLRQAGIAEG